jgi:ribonucleoside-diphosphate reductase alpha chain
VALSTTTVTVDAPAAAAPAVARRFVVDLPGEESAASMRQKRVDARAMGYEGDPCPSCQQFQLVRNGTCLKCMGCGSTTGCS